jgi:DMSO/TMAO reductase YedYZ molybdopterin-dependent catalytic subunit
MQRREILSTGAAALMTGMFSRWAQADKTEDGALILHSPRPQDLATPTAAFDRLITPVPVFFVRSHFGPPALDESRRLHVSGMVERKLDLSVKDLRRFEEVTVTAVLQCAGNGRALHEPRVPGVQWVHGAMGQAAWTGVRLADVLKAAGLTPEAAQVRLAGADLPPKPTVPGFIRGIPIARALDPTTLLAYRMNGEPLTLAHGAPLRLVVPGWSGNHWIKWLTDIRIQKDEVEGFFSQTGYRLPKQPVAPGAVVPAEQTQPVTFFPVKSVIATPAEGDLSKMGPQAIVGVAFSGEAAIQGVEVSVDGGASWAKATLEGEAGPGRWQVFRYGFSPKSPGKYRAIARATDAHGITQPEKAAWNPSGYFWNAWHSVTWEVSA